MKLVILDRDGVINEDSDEYIKSVDEWFPIEGSIEAISRLNKFGYKIAVATNQSGIARGLFDEFELARIHQKMCNLVEAEGGLIDGVFFCPHAPVDNCDCRKPRLGLLRAISEEFDISLIGVPFIGDSLKDIHAAKKAGCLPILVKTGKGRSTLSVMTEEDADGVIVVDDLQSAVNSILVPDSSWEN